MKASEAFSKSLYSVSNWDWQPDGSVVITLVNNNTGQSGAMRWKVVGGKLDKLLQDRDMEVKT